MNNSERVQGGHADHDTTHGQAMPVEDRHVVDPLAASGHAGHGGHGDHVAMFRRLF
jgi:P-type Cu2+ transporter